MKKFEHAYNLLYEKTGNILDLNTLLVPLLTMKRFHELESQMDAILPVFIMGFATLLEQIQDGVIQPNVNTAQISLWCEWCNEQSTKLPDDLTGEQAVRDGVAAMSAYLKYKGDLALRELVRVSEELGLYEDKTDDRTSGQVNA